MSNQRCRRPRYWKRPVIWVSTGLVYLAVLSVVPLAPGPKGDSIPIPVPNQCLVASNNPAATRAMPWYIRSGQWRADMRSLAAALRYLTDSESTAALIPQTNFIPGKADNA